MILNDPRITILIDNHAPVGLLAEHGFSLWIDTGAERLVFDTGQGSAFIHNARSLGIDVAQADALVLSHGHFDHTGGIDPLFKLAANPHLYCHPAAIQPRYSIREGLARPIHMPHAAMTAIDHMPEGRLHWVSEPMRISETIGLTGPIPRQTDFEDTGGPFYLDPEGRRSDPIADDLALWIHTPNGLVVCVGCCHAGVINTLRHIMRLNPGEKIQTLIGGLHLLAAGMRRMDRTIAELETFDVERIIACHCTGDPAVVALREALGNRVSVGAVGHGYGISI